MSENFEKFKPEPQLEPVSETEKSEPKIEEELSPEVIEGIMAKILNIDQSEIGYSAICGLEKTNPERMESILSNGLLGQDFFTRENIGPRKNAQENAKRDFIEGIKKKQAVAFFNITGRSGGLYVSDQNRSNPIEIANSYWVRDNRGGNMTAVILFDISPFEEEEPTRLRGKPKSGPGSDKERLFDQKNRTFRSDDNRPEEYLKWKATGFDPNERIKSYNDYNGGIDTEMGFVLSHRVAPRYFTGIVIKPFRSMLEEEIHQELQNRTNRYGYYSASDKKDFLSYANLERIEDERSDELLKEAKRIAELMKKVSKGKINLLVPIYDVHGNLLWPKQMSYEEVKKIVTGREKQKEEEK